MPLTEENGEMVENDRERERERERPNRSQCQWKKQMIISSESWKSLNQSCFWRSILDIQNESEELTLRLTTVVLKSNLGFLLDKILYSRPFQVLLLRLGFNFQDSCSGTFLVSHFFQNQKFYCIKPRAVKHISPIIQNNGFSSSYKERCFFPLNKKMTASNPGCRGHHDDPTNPGSVASTTGNSLNKMPQRVQGIVEGVPANGL